MDNLDPKAIAQAFVELTKARGTVQEILAITKQYNTALGLTQSHIVALEKSLQSQSRAAKELSLMSTDTRRSVEQRLAAERLSENVQESLADIATKRGQAEADLLLKQTMQKTGLTGVYAEQAKNLTLALRMGAITKTQYDNQVAALQSEEKRVKHIEEEVELYEEVANRLLEIREESEAWKHSLTKAFETAKAIGRDPKVFGAFALTQMVEEVSHVNHQMHELVDTGMQAGEAIRTMRDNFSIMSMIGLSKVAGVSKELVNQFGTANALTKEQRHTIGEMATSFGLAEKEAVDLTMAISRMPGESLDTAKNFKETAVQVGKTKGILPSQIMKEMAKNTGTMALFSKGGADAFAKGAAAAKKMGIEVSSIAAAAEKSLDFESSINAQMEASVLLGKQLNFDALRRAANSGDFNAVMEEQTKIMRQVGNLDNMSLLQKKKLAEAMGFTVEELTKFNAEQQFSTKYFGENSSALDNVIGKTLKFGGAIGGFVAQHGLMLLTLGQGVLSLMQYRVQKQLLTLQTTKETGADLTNQTVKKQGILTTIKDTAVNAARRLGKMLGIGTTVTETAVEGASDTVKKRSIFTTMALNAVNLIRNTIIGAGNLVLGIANGLLGLFGINTMAAGTAGATASPGIAALGTSIGAAGAAMIVAIPAILALGLALKLAAPALVGIATVIGNVLMKALEMLPAIIGAVSTGFVTMFTAASDNIGSLLLLGPALMMISTGLVGMGLALGPAMPVIASLIALAAVAPALSGLSIGGGFGGGGEENDKMDQMLAKLDRLVAATEKGGVINMDGKKVGEVLRLSVNSTSIR